MECLQPFDWNLLGFTILSMLSWVLIFGLIVLVLMAIGAAFMTVREKVIDKYFPNHDDGWKYKSWR